MLRLSRIVFLALSAICVQSGCAEAQKATPTQASPVTNAIYTPADPATEPGQRLPSSLTPPPGPSPRLTGPQIYGVRPGSPFLFTLSSTGTHPLLFSVKNLPTGLHLDPATGQISGKVTQRGTYEVTVTASNAHGKATRAFQIVVGDRLALTPPMGWNGYNRYGVSITDPEIREQTDAMVSKGLRDHGYSYVNLDEGWEGPRSTPPTSPNFSPGPLTGDPKKFPDLKALGDYIHAKGLKFGIYSTPREVGYQGFPGGSYDTPLGSLLCSPVDVQQFADWGVDYLKYDGDKPMGYDTAMTGASLGSLPRDIVYSLSNNAGCDPAYADYYARTTNTWRVGYDMSDNWDSMVSTQFNGYSLSSSFTQPDRGFWAAVTGPGRWLDADMLVVGILGGKDGSTHPANLSADEQYVQMTQQALLASPLLFGGDMPGLDSFTLGLLTNDAVLGVDQDPLGLQAVRVSQTGDPKTGTQVWERELVDGSRAVGLYNFGEAPATVTAHWKDLGLTGAQTVRDLWRQKDIGVWTDPFTASVPKHGVVFVTLTPATPGAPKITVQPVNADTLQGQATGFAVKATGAGVLTYQWTRDGKPISTATAARLTLPAPTMADSSTRYRCVVTNEIGRITSEEVVLRVVGTDGTNLAKDRPVVASSTQYGLPGSPASVVDGDPGTYWASMPFEPQWLYVDLGDRFRIRGVTLNWNPEAAKDYVIQIADSGADKLNTDKPWITLKSVSGNVGGKIVTYSDLSGTGRFVRIKATSRTTSGHVVLNEMEVYGIPLAAVRKAAL